jgi:hypothetical protein
MLNIILAGFYERDLRKLIEEINLFKYEENIWKTQGSIKNSSGNLALHIIGGMNYLIGTNLAGTGYVRNRNQEFTHKGIDRNELVTQPEELILLISKTLNGFTPEQMNVEYSIIFDGEKRTNCYLLIQLSLHLNYHLGQINYLRSTLE